MARPDLVLYDTTDDGVTTLTMNNPDRLNGWTESMMRALAAAMARAAEDPATKAVVLTGNGRYYCAGVNLGATMKLEHPKKLRAFIVEHNQDLFDRFIDFPKPILIAANGPAIGACVTSATLCDGIVAAEGATFSTPFTALGVSPEGCSSVHLPRLIGEESAHRMLGPEGWKPTAAEALEVGLVDAAVPADQLLPAAHAMARAWIAEGRTRSFRAGATAEELREVNARESVALAESFLGVPFLRGQFRFLWKKKKWGPALTFLALWWTRPVWRLAL